MGLSEGIIFGSALWVRALPSPGPAARGRAQGVIGVPAGGSCILPTGTSLERGAGQAAELRDRLEPPAPAQPLRAGSTAGHVQGEQKPAERELSARAVLPPAAPAFPLLLPLSIFFPFPALLCRGTLVPGSGQPALGPRPSTATLKGRLVPGGAGSARDPTTSCPRDRELPKGFPYPELFSLDKTTWSIPRSVHGSLRVQCTCGCWEDQEHSRATPTAGPA